jgi:hypothetical protein
MAEFLTTTGCSHQLEQLITNSRERLVLISPYLQVSQIHLDRILEAEARGVQISVVCIKIKLRESQRDQLARITRLDLRFLENLHAKCYANESGMVITSMNLYEYSEKTNREMGVFLNAGEPSFGVAWREIESILAAARPEQLAAVGDDRSPTRDFRGKGDVPTRAVERRQASARGFCVRCRGSVRLDPERPFCIECYSTWSVYENEEYPERWCHDCGADADTSMARPLCRPCFGAPRRRSVGDTR